MFASAMIPASLAEGRVALVGRKGLAAEGVKICIAARRRELLEALAKEIVAAGGTPPHIAVVDVMEELMKFTLLTRDFAPYLVDRYSERRESAEEMSKRVNQLSI